MKGRATTTIALQCSQRPTLYFRIVPVELRHSVSSETLFGNERAQEREMRHRERFAAEKRRKDVQQLQVRSQTPVNERTILGLAILTVRVPHAPPRVAKDKYSCIAR